MKSKKYAIFSADSEIARLFQFIKNELKEKQKYYDTAIKGCVYQLVAFMSREGLIEDGSIFLNDGEYQKILSALTYAKENFADKVTLESLCAYLQTDKFNFCKQFKRTTGTTFFDYLTFVRLQHADELLLSSKKNITEIALSCGFSSVQYFNRVFLQRRGCSPTAYRNMITKQ